MRAVYELTLWITSSFFLRNPEFHHGLLGLARIYGLSGRKSEAIRFLPELREGTKHRGVSAFDMALVYAALEERDEAFAFLERAYAERSEQLTHLNVEPGFDLLRPDPRFQDLLRRVGLQ